MVKLKGDSDWVNFSIPREKPDGEFSIKMPTNHRRTDAQIIRRATAYARPHESRSRFLTQTKNAAAEINYSKSIFTLKMLKVVKVRLYPDTHQQQSLEQSFGNCRWLWNHCLNLMNQTYKQTGKGLSGYEVKKLIPQLKKEYEWLSLAYSACLQQVCLNLGVAFQNFFEKRAKYPRFKSKHGKQSLQYPQNVKIFDNYLEIPKIGKVKAVIHRPISGKIKTITISKNCSQQYFAAVLFEDGTSKPASSTQGKAIGVDVGLTHFCITSEGSKFDHPRFWKKQEKNLKIKQQQLSRKQKGSNNRNKSRLKVAKVHRKITNCREDFLHKLSRRIVDENQVIIVEDLAVKNMMQNHKRGHCYPSSRLGNVYDHA